MILRTAALPFASLRRLSHALGVDRAVLRDLAATAGGLYEPFDRQRIAGRGKWRHIDNPRPELKRVQKRIAHVVLNRVELLPETMYGGVPGRNLRDNALVHVGQPVVVALDLKQCFDRVTDRAVFDALRRRLGCGEDVAALLTRLTTLERRLPQGAPTSTMLANFCLVPLHDELAALCRDKAWRLSFWVDDIVISGPDAERCIDEAARLAMKHGHGVSCRKKHIMRRGSDDPPFVTGQSVTRKTSVGRGRVAELRERILALADDHDPLDRDLRRIRGVIASMGVVSREQADRLGEFADRLLPASGRDGPSPRTDATRPCRGKRHHNDA